ncbi:hepatoma-derived growth factor-related protein 2-like [Falco naumanni]|uniref:hepatoma-derived growth factor-related protein 2-like n=1 Tax=Falco naumanni TaxID=148594 RepID=UPI001ADE9040|nr:hepatoma-derived growth factor-related protein 2-like [Falco naumanni]XP_040434351.1 hepatoma-derived growth factor-related protein 2-like [Falco naumanni]XP_040434352.1 hepatoma-derived growth factor-related protein 2-like [Falco naumanni]XP_040434353.1 hepatoma-derived growth factor-related protein 2-like [Falco naumanni]XP_040434355.1 hepatoma-derived growth factor-related protein 2-like [Falco naumanni]
MKLEKDVDVDFVVRVLKKWVKEAGGKCPWKDITEIILWMKGRGLIVNPQDIMRCELWEIFEQEIWESEKMGTMAWGSTWGKICRAMNKKREGAQIWAAAGASIFGTEHPRLPGINQEAQVGASLAGDSKPPSPPPSPPGNLPDSPPSQRKAECYPVEDKNAKWDQKNLYPTDDLANLLRRLKVEEQKLQERDKAKESSVWEAIRQGEDRLRRIDKAGDNTQTWRRREQPPSYLDVATLPSSSSDEEEDSKNCDNAASNELPDADWLPKYISPMGGGNCRIVQNRDSGLF